MSKMPLTLYLEKNKGLPTLMVLDQTLLPTEKKYISLTKAPEIWEAIFKLRVRGAPAIGIAAAYGIYVVLAQEEAAKGHPFSKEEIIELFNKTKAYLGSSRPTAVNLFWALERMENQFNKGLKQGLSTREIIEALGIEAATIDKEDGEICRKIGLNGLKVLKPGSTILTHCNAGSLATSRYGTALAPLHLGKEQGMDFKVYADETRPLLQGARLTAWELNEAGIDVTLICDNMAATVMSQGKIHGILTGCDRVAANGDSANKIGTHGVAILAKHFNIPFYICAPKSTIDVNCATGKDIEIEERAGEEITHLWYERPMAPEGVKTFNPAFDVTPAQLITGIITEDGILYPPYGPAIAELFKD